MPPIIRGTTIEDKLSSIEHILQSFQRRLSTKVVGLLPPIALLGDRHVLGFDGVVFSAVCPVYGKLVRVCLRVGAFSAQTIACTLVHESRAATYTEQLNIKERTTVIPLDVLVSPADYFSITMFPVDGVTDVSVALLIVPTLTGQVRQESFALDQFLLLEERENAEAIR